MARISLALSFLLASVPAAELIAQRTVADARYALVQPASNTVRRAGALERPARLKVADVALDEALRALHKHSGVALAYSPSLVPADRRVTCLCTDLTVGGALALMLRGLAVQVTEIEGDMVLLVPESREATSPLVAPLETRRPGTRAGAGLSLLAAGRVVGRVTNATTGQGVGSAQVAIDGTTLGAMSAEDGNFVIAGVPEGNHVVRVRRLGFTSTTRNVSVGTGDVRVDVALSPISVSLDQVVVTGTAGQARRREIGNSIGAINAEQLATAPRQNVSDLLQGQVTGVQQFANEGQVGSGSTIAIRGLSSVTQSSEPLIYIDGIRVNNQTYMNNTLTRTSAMGNPGPAGAQNSPKPLDNLNPDDVLRIEVIRGPAATTLYGTEAAAGVIQIFTKRGQMSGRAQWNAVLTGGIRTQTGNTLGPVVGKDDDYIGLKRFLRNGEQREVDLAVSGGNENVSYFLSGNHEFAEGTLPKNDSRRVGLRGNFGFQPQKWLNIDVNTAFSNRNSNFMESGDNTYGFLLNVFRGTQDYTGGKHDMLLAIDNIGATDHFVGGVTFTSSAFSNIATKLTVGVDYTNSFNEETIPFDFPLLPRGQRNTSSWMHRTLTADLASTWSAKLGAKVTSAFSVGGQFFQDLDHTQLGTAEGFGGPGDVTLSSGATSRANEAKMTTVNAGLFVQEMVGINDRLFLTFGARADGNSAFGSDLGLQVYPKVSASYVLSDEGFWPDWWQVMKLRAAWGEAGKAPGAFDAVRTWTPVAGYEAQAGVTASNVGNPDLGPERTGEIELGFETSALDDRLSADVTWYRKTTNDALFRVTTPPSEGFLIASLRNVGQLRSEGVELSLTGVPVSRRNVTWSVTGRYSSNKSEVLDLGGAAPFTVGFASLGQWIREGYPVVSIFGRKVTNPDEMADPKYAADQYLGPVYPTHNYGFNTSLQLYRRLTLSALAEGAGGHMALNNMPWQTARRNLWPECNERQPYTNQPAIWRARCAGALPDRESWIRPADYFKLRTLTAAYLLPSGAVPGASAASLTLQVQNPWKWQRHPGLDPELTRGGTYAVFPARYEYYQLPPARLITLAARLTF
ncbi:MAG TPA: TonB-dependent receptor [Gemmatimonadaceae bacterium]|nr:TonB-dependent receptor [Gemmatimonadaceae bacterium]